MTAPITSPSTASAEVTHACVRCGAAVPIHVGLCENCNPLGLRDVSATQVHGVAFVGVVLAVVALALLGRLLLAGVGPFSARVADLASAGDGLAVTLTVTNQGKAPGQTTCRLTDPGDRSGLGAAFVLSPQIEPGRTATFTKTITTLGSAVRALDVECSAP